MAFWVNVFIIHELGYLWQNMDHKFRQMYALIRSGSSGGSEGSTDPLARFGE